MTNIKDEEEEDELCLADLLYIKFQVSEAVFVHKKNKCFNLVSSPLIHRLREFKT